MPSGGGDGLLIGPQLTLNPRDESGPDKPDEL